MAKDGEVIEVTSHNRPIARIVGISDPGREGLRQLLASGQATWSGGKPTFFPPSNSAQQGRHSARWCWKTGAEMLNGDQSRRLLHCREADQALRRRIKPTVIPAHAGMTCAVVSVVMP
jgi:antitoxin (DNA-binding transcriptional repressor) of toxin-antitoxin stability system